MNVDISQLQGLFNPELSYSGQLQKGQMQDATREQMLAQAAQMRQATSRSAQLTPEEVSQAQYQNSQPVRDASLRGTNAVSGYNEANTAAVWNKIDADKQKEIVNGVLDGHKQIAQAGIAIATQGGNGQVAYDQLKQMLTTQLQQASTPRQKQMIQKSLTDLEQQAKLTGMLSWTPQKLLEESKKMQKTLFDQNPEALMENLKGSWDVKKAGVSAGATIEAARIGAASRENVAANKPVKEPTTAQAAEVRALGKRLDAGEITSEDYSKALADIMAMQAAPNRAPGVGLVMKDNKVKLGEQEKVPVYTPPKGGSETEEINGVTYVKVPGGWKKQ